MTSQLQIGDWDFGFNVFGFGFGDLGAGPRASSCWRERRSKIGALRGDLCQTIDTKSRLFVAVFWLAHRPSKSLADLQWSPGGGGVFLRLCVALGTSTCSGCD